MARIATIGLLDHITIFHLDQLPASGGSATVRNVSRCVGGSSATIAMALVRLGEAVTLRAVVGSDEPGDYVMNQLAEHGVDCGMVTRADTTTTSTTILLDPERDERVTLRQDGAAIRKGDRLDIAALFDHDLVILDMGDAPLRRFLTDLPAHTRPDVRLLGTLTRLLDHGEPDARQIAFRFDTIVGTEHQFRQLLGVEHAGDLIGSIQRQMPGANLRTAILVDGNQGCRWVTREDSGVTNHIAGTTGSINAFVAGIAWGMVRRLPWPETTRFATAVSVLSTQTDDGQQSLPALADVQQLMSRRT